MFIGWLWDGKIVKYIPIQSWNNKERSICNKYIVIKVPQHPHSHSGWVYEHRLIMERELGRVLKSYETVHHINLVKSQNDLKNLFVCTRIQHNKAHR